MISEKIKKMKTTVLVILGSGVGCKMIGRAVYVPVKQRRGGGVGAGRVALQKCSGVWSKTPPYSNRQKRLRAGAPNQDD